MPMGFKVVWPDIHVWVLRCGCVDGGVDGCDCRVFRERVDGLYVGRMVVIVDVGWLCWFRHVVYV